MKINGKVRTAPNEAIIVIPRPEHLGGDIVFKARAIADLDDFELRCPRPKPPMGMGPGGKAEPSLENKSYLLALKDYNERRFSYIIVMSLQASDMEWDTVVLDDPNTWGNYEKDLKSAGLNYREVNAVVAGCMEANALSEEKLEEARSRFLALEAVLAAGSSSQTDGQ